MQNWTTSIMVVTTSVTTGEVKLTNLRSWMGTNGLQLKTTTRTTRNSSVGKIKEEVPAAAIAGNNNSSSGMDVHFENMVNACALFGGLSSLAAPAPAPVLATTTVATPARASQQQQQQQQQEPQTQHFSRLHYIRQLINKFSADALAAEQMVDVSPEVVNTIKAHVRLLEENEQILRTEIQAMWAQRLNFTVNFTGIAAAAQPSFR